jgi:uncharacterized protein YbbK (DUF523 family)
MPPVLISACLLGVRCRYDGGSKPDPVLIERLRADGVHLVPVCPEQLGGLPTPRPPAEIHGGDGRDVLDGRARVINADGRDVTGPYVRGADETLAIARQFGCRRAILKTKSPACGPRTIKRGERTIPGIGVTAALLQRHGIELIPADGEQGDGDRA